MGITNTSKQDPLLTLAQLIGDTSRGIEAMEGAGQAELVQSDLLPTDCREDVRAAFIAAGGEFLGVVEDDPIFQRARLPGGWKIVPTDHSMWSKLLDKQGRERFSIFYKAAFYDRRSLMHAERRLRADVVDSAGQRQYSVAAEREVPPYFPVVLDGDREIWRGDAVDGERGDYSALIRCDAVAHVWLDNNYPEWRDPAAYWGDDIPAATEDSP